MSSRVVGLRRLPLDRIEVRSATLAAGLGLLVLVGAWLSGWPSYGSAASGPLHVSRPRVVISPGRIDATVDVKSAADDSITGWFFISQVGSNSLPWDDFAYKSTELQIGVHRGKRATFHWSESTAIPPSLYHITFWFHKQVGGQSVHVAGGNFGLSAVPITGTALLHQLFGQAVAYVGQLTVAYQQSQFAFTASIRPGAGVTQGTLSWELLPAGDAKGVPVYRGKQQPLQFAPGTDDATQITVSESVAIPRGRYDLWIDIDGNGTSGQSQRVVYSNALVQGVDPIFTRQTAGDGPFQLGVSVRPNALQAGQENVLNLDVSWATVGGDACGLRWRLLGAGNQAVLEGDSGASCDHPSIRLPDNFAAGRYRLELSAYAGDSLQAPWSDTIVVNVDVLN